MKPALGYNWIEPLTSWQDIPNGELLRELENDMLRPNLKYCFGQHLLKVGCLTSEMDCSESLIPHQVSLAPSVTKLDNVGVAGEFDELPLAENAIDAVVINHVLEFSADPHQVLREAHRVLLPNGNLMLSVFNPISLLLLSRLWPIKSHKEFWRGRWFTIGRIKDWLNLLGFEVIEESYCCYSTMLAKKSQLQSSLAGRLFAGFLPKLGSVCIITAKKREWPLTPIRPRLRYKTVFHPAVRSASVSRIHTRPVSSKNAVN